MSRPLTDAEQIAAALLVVLGICVLYGALELLRYAVHFLRKRATTKRSTSSHG